MPPPDRITPIPEKLPNHEAIFIHYRQADLCGDRRSALIDGIHNKGIFPAYVTPSIPPQRVILKSQAQYGCLSLLIVPLSHQPGYVADCREQINPNLKWITL